MDIHEELVILLYRRFESQSQRRVDAQHLIAAATTAMTDYLMHVRWNCSICTRHRTITGCKQSQVVRVSELLVEVVER